MKIEKDEALFEGGVRGAVTLGSPIAIGIVNRDYENWKGVMGPLAVDPAAAAEKRLTRPRPGHADLAGGMKYGARDLRDVLERASARESAARVAAGAVCKLLLRACGIDGPQRGPRRRRRGRHDLAAVVRGARAGPRRLAPARPRSGRRSANGRRRRRRAPGRRDARRLDPRRCARRAGRPRILRLVGSPSSTAASGRRCSRCRRSRPSRSASTIEASLGPGSRAHDEIEKGADGRLRRRTNRAGGLEAGVSNGEDVIAVVTMKPISTLARGLDSVDLETGEPARSAYERSDVAAVAACGVIAEAMLAFVLADALLELTGGDRLEDVSTRLAAHRERVARYPH